MEKQADLRKWFKERWVDISRKNPDGSHPECGRDEAKLGKKGYPKCRPKAKAAQMTKKEKSYAVRAKRSKRQGVGGKPTMVPTEKPDRKSMKKEASILEKLAFLESTRDAKNTLTSTQLDKEDPEFTVSGVSKKNALRGMGHNLSREDMATVKNTDASPKYMDAGGTSNRARLKTWHNTMKGNQKDRAARRRVYQLVKSNTDEPSIIAIKKDGTRHLVAGNSRASLRSALGMPIKAHVFHDVEQTKTALLKVVRDFTEAARRHAAGETDPEAQAWANHVLQYHQRQQEADSRRSLTTRLVNLPKTEARKAINKALAAKLERDRRRGLPDASDPLRDPHSNFTYFDGDRNIHDSQTRQQVYERYLKEKPENRVDVARNMAHDTDFLYRAQEDRGPRGRRLARKHGKHVDASNRLLGQDDKPSGQAAADAYMKKHFGR